MEYNENVEYCKYIENKCKELNLDLDKEEIQIIANLYVDELYNDGVEIKHESIIDNELLLFDCIDQYRDLNSKEKFSQYDYIGNKENINDKEFEKMIKRQEIKEKEDEELYKQKSYLDRELNAKGGYGYNEDYDDHGLDESIEHIR